MMLWRTIIFTHFLTSAVSAKPATHLRRPIALSVRGENIIVANRRSGTLALVDARQLRIISETRIGKTLSDMAVGGGDDLVYVTDEAAGELIHVAVDGETPRVVRRIRVAAYPVTVRVSRDGSRRGVASLWSRRYTILNGDVSTVVDLPFAPREQVLLPDGKSAVLADAFGGKLAIVNLEQGVLDRVRTLQANNIRGMSFDNKEILLAHQLFDPNTPTETSRISWGQVVGNVLRAVPLTELTAGKANIRHWSLYPLGQNGRGAGDPGAIEIATSGVAAVALSGVGEVALRQSPLETFRRIKVGKHPTALAFSADGNRLFVANTFDDSISVIDVSASRVVATISLGPKPPLSEADLGEQLFYDARLSFEGWYSCNSCHTDGHTSGNRNDNFSDNSFSTPKQIPSLLGVEESRPWGWFGQMQTHEMQVQRSIIGTMRGPAEAVTAENVNAIAAFIRTLPPAPGISTARADTDLAAVARGRLVFEENRCGRCHALPDYTSERATDVGLVDEAGARRFNPPSLLGVSQRDAFLHDGRALSLEEVFSKFNHPDAERTRIGKTTLSDLLSLLNSL
jgi:YVTN family beta-propeller protein